MVDLGTTDQSELLRTEPLDAEESSDTLDNGLGSVAEGPFEESAGSNQSANSGFEPEPGPQQETEQFEQFEQLDVSFEQAPVEYQNSEVLDQVGEGTLFESDPEASDDFSHQTSSPMKSASEAASLENPIPPTKLEIERPNAPSVLLKPGSKEPGFEPARDAELGPSPEPPVADFKPDSPPGIGTMPETAIPPVDSLFTDEADSNPVPIVRSVAEPDLETPSELRSESGMQLGLQFEDESTLASARTRELVPEPVPFGVSYQFASDAEVTRAAKDLQRFLDEMDRPATYGSELLMIYSGAWEMIREELSTEAGHLGERYVILPPNGRALEVQGGMAFEPMDVITILSALRSVIGEGARVRSLQTLEMAEWWSYTGIGIEEPALVVEAEEGTKQYLFFFQKGKITAVDELSALPDFL